MKHITDREILEARAVLMHEIEAGRVQTAPEPMESHHVNQRMARIKFINRKQYDKDRSKLVKQGLGALALPGEIPLKQAIREQARIMNVGFTCAFERYQNGWFKHWQIRRVNARVIFVKTGG